MLDKLILKLIHLDNKVKRIFLLLWIKIKYIFSLGSSKIFNKALIEFKFNNSILSIKTNLGLLLKDDRDGSWMELQQITDQNIITAHRWQPSLSGIVSSGKMNNTGSEIRISYDLVMRTVIQDTIEQVFKPMRDAIGKVLKLDASSLEVQFESPIGFAADIDIKQIADVNELRSLIGLEERPDLEDVYLTNLNPKDGGNRL